MMKQISTLTRLMLVALLTTTVLASCDEDSDLAYDLNGVWQGEIATSYFTYRYGRQVDYTQTEICFDQRGVWEAGGTGYEVDWNGYERPYRVNFDWSVRDGRIYLKYHDGTNTVVVRDFVTYYRGSRMRFSGYFDDNHTGETLAHFDLEKVYSPDGYYENRYSHYSYARTRQEQADSTAVAEP